MALSISTFGSSFRTEDVIKVWKIYDANSIWKILELRRNLIPCCM